VNTVLFYDTETSGLPMFGQPSEHPDQPHVVQLGACLVDLDPWQTLATLDVMVRPEGWTIPDEVAAMAEAIQADLGPVDLLVCNAGIASRGGTVAQTELGELDRLMRTHVYGAFQLCGALLPGMRTRPRGDVVVISSVAARQLAAHMAPYGMAKVALEAMALTLAKEERNNGIHVNVVAPGLVDTEMGRRLVKGVMGIDDMSTLDASSPFGRVCRPEDIAEVVRFLAGPSAGYVTGQIVTVDGGG
jgi:NAD(P)-dependent dehydrogenase (short-subunit alcohol dehydrogenase family)